MAQHESDEQRQQPDWARACLSAARDRREHRLGELAGRRRLGGARQDASAGQPDADRVIDVSPARAPKPSLGRPRR